MHICPSSLTVSLSDWKVQSKIWWEENILITCQEHVCVLKLRTVHTPLFRKWRKTAFFSYFQTFSSDLFFYYQWEMNWHFKRTVYHKPKISVQTANRQYRDIKAHLIWPLISICMAYICLFWISPALFSLRLSILQLYQAVAAVSVCKICYVHFP